MNLNKNKNVISGEALDIPLFDGLIWGLEPRLAEAVAPYMAVKQRYILLITSYCGSKS